MVDYAHGKKASQARGEGAAFGDIVGQTEFKQALLAVAANDDLDGLLVRGEKGTAKSTAVRALAALLPVQRAVADCPYGCPPGEPQRQCDECRQRDDPPTEIRTVPLVTLPLGATRDRVVGTLSVDDALDGNSEFEPGLLARANRGILYVDEVNLLDDHLVDVLLDASASGINRVERDGVSVSHPAEFTLIGTMNPEEGDLRPQLRDRFALQATVTGCTDVEDRVAIVRQALGDRTVGDERDYRTELRTAREVLPDVTLPEEFLAEIAELCRDAGVDGHRGDIAVARTARTLAALESRATVIESDVRRAAELALPHRLQSRPFDDAPDPEDVIDDHFEDGEPDGDGTDGESETGDGDGENDAADGDAGGTGGAGGDEETESGANGGDDPEETEADDQAGSGPGDDPEPEETEAEGDRTRGPTATADGSDHGGGEGTESDADRDESGADEADDAETATPLLPGQERAAVGDGAAPDVEIPDAVTGGEGSGSRVRTTPSPNGDGPRIRTEPADSDDGIDAAASVRAASRRGGSRVESRDLRQSVRAGSDSSLVLFVVDASASMRAAMRTAKGTVLELLKDAYRERDEVGFVAVAGDSAEVVLPPTDSVSHAARHLKDLPTGDRTPLPDGLRTARSVVERTDPAASVIVLVSDGRANVADGSPTAATRTAARELASLDATVVVVDAGDGGRAGVLDVVCDATDAERVPLSALSPERVAATVDGN
ncbi:VWA domain-containing protein [Halorientalis halophila]|uniref:VWA domain-containing protein n=1 Tax=Halorientalis halophila TaxID=3108499 RepID=UPI003009219F